MTTAAQLQGMSLEEAEQRRDELISDIHSIQAQLSYYRDVWENGAVPEEGRQQFTTYDEYVNWRPRALSALRLKNRERSALKTHIRQLHNLAIADEADVDGQSCPSVLGALYRMVKLKQRQGDILLEREELHLLDLARSVITHERTEPRAPEHDYRVDQEYL
jgi:hypothetical protein